MKRSLLPDVSYDFEEGRFVSTRMDDDGDEYFVELTCEKDIYAVVPRGVEASCAPYFSNIPTEIANKILTRCRMSELYVLKSTCKRFHHLIHCAMVSDELISVWASKNIEISKREASWYAYIGSMRKKFSFHRYSIPFDKCWHAILVPLFEECSISVLNFLFHDYRISTSTTITNTKNNNKLILPEHPGYWTLSLMERPTDPSCESFTDECHECLECISDDNEDEQCAHVKTLVWCLAKGCKYSPKDLFMNAAEKGHVCLLRWLSWHNADTFRTLHQGESKEDVTKTMNDFYLYRTKMCKIAAANNRRNVLEWTRTEKIPWNESVCKGAASMVGCDDEENSSKPLKLLQWIREVGCPWDKTVYFGPIRAGRLETVRWLGANGCPTTDHPGDNTLTHVAASAMWDSHDEETKIKIIVVLNYLVDVLKCPMSESINRYAEALKDQKLIIWALERGCKWVCSDYSDHAALGHLDLLKWVLKSDSIPARSLLKHLQKWRDKAEGETLSWIVSEIETTERENRRESEESC